MNFTAALEFYPEILTLIASIAIGIPLLAFIGVIVTWYLSTQFNQKKLIKEVAGKHCLITGASQGLGKALAIELAQAGAHVTILARSQDKLDKAIKEIKEHKVNPEQIIQAYSVDLCDYGSCLGFATTLTKNGHEPFWVVSNAGGSISGFLASRMPAEKKGKFDKCDHSWMMDSNYVSAVNLVRALVAATRVPGDNEISGISAKHAQKMPKRIVFVGSILSILSMIGYSAYSGSKYAIRGFAEALRSELAPLGIKVSFYLPGNMDTPGYEQENLYKPEITKVIEGSSALVTAKSAAQVLLAGMQHDRFYISNDLLGELARVSVNGANPRPNMLLEILATPIPALIFSIWVAITEGEIKTFFKKQNKKNE